MQDTLYLAAPVADRGRRAARRRSCAPIPPACRSATWNSAPSAGPADRAGTRLPPRRPRPDPLADVHPGRRTRRRRGRHAGGPKGTLIAVRAASCSALIGGRASVRASFPTPSRAGARHQLRRLRRHRPPPVEARRPGRPRGAMRHVQRDRLDRSPRQRHGPSGGVRGGRLRPGARHAALPSASASSGSPCSSGASRTSGCSTRTTCASWSNFRCEARPLLAAGAGAGARRRRRAGRDARAARVRGRLDRARPDAGDRPGDHRATGRTASA